MYRCDYCAATLDDLARTALDIARDEILAVDVYEFEASDLDLKVEENGNIYIMTYKSYIYGGHWFRTREKAIAAAKKRIAGEAGNGF